MAYDEPPSSQLLVEPLSEREQDIIRGISEGLSNADLAERLFLAPSTVKWYIRQLNQKLYTSNRKDIVRRTHELGLLEFVEPTPSALRPRDNLPRQTTPFVGREAELDDIHRLIDKPEVRLLTILAPGGMGKTRLALEAAEQQFYNFSDGVYFVPLQALTEIAQIIPAIAASSFYPFQADNRSQQQQVLDFLANKQMLLLIDNFEHLSDAAPLLNEILWVAPEVKLLVTSREKLNLIGETVYVLQGMEVPMSETLDDAIRPDAVQLLQQAARRIQPDWQIIPANWDAVVRVCQLTYGMPLGILLATSWLDVYSLERICDEIQKSLDILESEMRDIPERQRSIRVVFENSWKRLKPVEQEVLMKMSVFKGGCSPQAAEHITGAHPRNLQSLVDKALLSKDRQGRYHIHELLRQYAKEQLDQSMLLDTVRNAHMRYYAEEVYQNEAKLKNHRQIEARDAIKSDFENIREAWFWAIQTQHSAATEAMIEALYIGISDNERRIELFSKAVERLTFPLERVDQRLVAKLKARHATLLPALGKVRQIEPILRECLAVARQHNDQSEIAFCLVMLSIAIEGTTKRALILCEESLAIYTELEDKWNMAHIHFHLGYLNGLLGNSETSHQHTLEAYHLHKHLGNKRSLPMVLSNLGARMIAIGDWDLAENYVRDALAVYEEIGEPSAWFRTHLAAVCVLKGHLTEAEDHARKGLTLAKDYVDYNLAVFSISVLSHIADIKGNHDESYQLIQESMTYVKFSTNSVLKVFAQLQLGWTLCSIKAFEDALEHLLFAARKSLESRHIAYMLYCVAGFAQIMAHRDQHQVAVELLGLAFQHPARIGWFDIHPRIIELRKSLNLELGIETYNFAWELGKSRDIEMVMRELIVEFSDDN